MKKEKHMSWLGIQVSSFKKSLRPGIVYLYNVFIDIIFYFVIISATFFFTGLMAPKLLVFQDANMLLSDLQSDRVPVDLQQQVSAIKADFTLVVAYTIIYLLLLFLVYSCFKCLIWKNIAQNPKSGFFKARPKMLLRFAAANLIVILSFFVIVITSYALMKESVFVFFVSFILIPVALYTSMMLQALVARLDNIRASISGLFSFGFKRIYFFMIPLIIIDAVLVTGFVVIAGLRPYMGYSSFIVTFFILAATLFTWTKHLLGGILYRVMEKFS